MSQPDHYVAVDVERIQEFVFGSRKLKDIRGASQLLVEVEETLRGKVTPPATLVYSSGGVTLARFPSDGNAKAFADQARRVYRAATGDAVSVVTVVSPATDPATDHDRIQGRLRAAKEQRREAECGFPAIAHAHLPHVQLCHQCGLRGASRLIDADRLCVPCALRREKGRGHLPPESALVASLGRNAELPDDFGQFREARCQTRSVREKSFLAVVVADGNGFGDHIERLVSAAAAKGTVDKCLGDFSAGVDASLQQALVEAVKQVYPDPLRVLPLRVLLAGGDDLLLVVEASRAFDFSLALASGFEANTRGRADLGLGAEDALTLSIGVAFAKVSHPFSQTYDFAHRLLSQAKRPQPAGQGVATVSTKAAVRPARINAGVIRSSVLDPAREGRTALGLPSTRPWTLAEMRQFIGALEAREVGSIPRNKVKALGAALRADFEAPRNAGTRLPVSMEYKVWRSHLRAEERDAFDTILATLPGAQLWCEREGDPVSPVADWLEFMDFVRP